MNKLRTQKAVYAHVRKHLLTQGRKATNKGGAPVHRTESCMCSIGCMIPDEWCDLTMNESGTICFSTPKELIGNSDKFVRECNQYACGSYSHTMAAVAEYHELKPTPRTVHLLNDLERVHEDFPVRDWEDALDHIGYAYGFKGV